MSKGKFDDLSHEKLYAMIEHAKPDHLTRVGSALTSAGDSLDAVSLMLKVFIDQVHWQGEGGEAFRNWGAEMTNQAARLGDHVRSVGTHVGHAGNGLAEVKSAMPKPAVDGQCFADAEKEKQRLASNEEHRKAAVDLMNKLDSYYSVARTDIKGLKEPQFPLLPPTLNPPEDAYKHPSAVPSIEGAVAPRGGIVMQAASATASGDPSAVGYSRHRTENSSPRVHPGIDSSVHTSVDSTTVTPKPHVPVGPGSNSHVPDGPGQQSGAPEPRVVPIPRPVVPSMPSATPGGTRAPGIPGGRSESKVVMPRPVGSSDGIVGGTPARPGTQPGVARPPRGVVIGDERSPAGQGLVGTGSPARGTAVGGEPGATGRGPMGMGHPAAGGGAAAPRQISPGRRFASEPGGVVGDLRGKSQGRSEFTPGGTGLVRGGQGSTGMPLMNGASPGKPQRRQGTQRPDYLTEDEETWTGGQRHTVPRVIE